MNLSNLFMDHWNSLKIPSDLTVLIAVSGGMDSMVLCSLCLNAKIPFAMAHCNYQLRGTDSDLDESLVQEWGRINHIPIYITRFQTMDNSEEWKKGIQETARILRYEWLEKIRLDNAYGAILTAHHANDNAETLLFNLFRGSGIAGLHGIPQKNGAILRPLLPFSKNEIKAYADLHQIVFREDSSNASDKYQRNAIRLNILPEIEKFFPGIVDRLNANIFRFQQVETLYQRELNRQIKHLIQIRGKDAYIPIKKLLKAPALETLCYELLKPYGFQSSQIQQILALAKSESGHWLSSENNRIIKDRDFLIITTIKSEETDFISVEGVPCKVKTDSFQLDFNYIGTPDSIPDSKSFAYIDATKLRFPLVLRKWRQGDYFYPIGMHLKKKKLAKLLIDQKVPLHLKEQVWVLESEKRIVWVVGMRLDERFKIHKDSEKVLKVELRMN